VAVIATWNQLRQIENDSQVATVGRAMKRVLLLLPLVVLVAACGRANEGAESSSSDAAITVAATTRQVADFARQVGGDRANVEAIIPANADPHDFEPRPSDARLVAGSDVVLQSGGDIDGWLDDLVENAGGDATQVDLIEVVKTREGGHAHEDEHGADEDDPHWWQNPQNVELAVGRIAEAFADADPDGADEYRANARAYTAKLRALDTKIEQCLDGVPERQRKLVTNHDAFGYFADRYHVEVLGSILPALSTSAQPSAGDIRRLVAAIEREGVSTVFPESAVSVRLEKAVARDAGAKVGKPLYADTLGPGDGVSYLEALTHDARLIAASMGAACQL
jgi:zinc/manganese transport system substrate-binding protein